MVIIIKPILDNINAFDASYERIINIISWSGFQVFKNTCTIRNNTTNAIVYQQTQDSMQLRHIIPPYSLTNGTLYNITIRVFDQQNNASQESDPILFYCYTTPSFYIGNLVENQVVKNSSYQIELNYNQSQGEELQYYQIHLYNTNQNQIWSSGVRYNTSNLTINVSNLDDNGVYYIRATGMTINGMSLNTGLTRFSVNYVMPSVYAIVTLENIKREGSVKIQSNIISLEGKYYDGTPTYIDDDYIDLTNQNNRVVFDEGFSLDDNFYIELKGYDFTDFSTILNVSNGIKTIKLNKKRGLYSSENGIEKTYFDLIVPSAYGHYIIQSNYIANPSPTDILLIQFKRYNNVYDLRVKNLST